MSGSGASNLGYGNVAPLSNINGAYANVDSSNWPGTFGSNQIPGLPGLVSGIVEGGVTSMSESSPAITNSSFILPLTN